MVQGHNLIRPGEEPREIQELLSKFFAILDSCFPGKCIIWEEWDHERLDKAANYLCSYLGYSRGAHFLTAYGYTLITKDKLDVPTESMNKAATVVDPNAPDAAENISEAHTGRIVSVLPNGNSGFVRDDADGKDYYFNVRSFLCWVDDLSPGLAVQFRITQRIDRRRVVLRPNEVDLRFVS